MNRARAQSQLSISPLLPLAGITEPPGLKKGLSNPVPQALGQDWESRYGRCASNDA